MGGGLASEMDIFYYMLQGWMLCKGVVGPCNTRMDAHAYTHARTHARTQARTHSLIHTDRR